MMLLSFFVVHVDLISSPMQMRLCEKKNLSLVANVNVGVGVLEFGVYCGTMNRQTNNSKMSKDRRELHTQREMHIQIYIYRIMRRNNPIHIRRKERSICMCDRRTKGNVHMMTHMTSKEKTNTSYWENTNRTYMP